MTKLIKYTLAALAALAVIAVTGSTVAGLVVVVVGMMIDAANELAVE